MARSHSDGLPGIRGSGGFREVNSYLHAVRQMKVMSESDAEQTDKQKYEFSFLQ